jgi:EmrB/QacA subfamily drug resistance transporter
VLNLETTQQNEKRWIVLAVLCIVLFIISIDNTVLNLAIPAISLGLGATTSQLQWIVDAYTLVFASLLITTGTIGDHFGRKRLLMIGLGLFCLGSLGAALSVNTTMLIGFRAFLGMAGALIMPSTLSIIINVFRDARERARAIAIWSSIFSVGAGIGPIIGGFLISSFHWSSVFFLNVPITLIGLVGTIIYVPESRNLQSPRPDFAGVSLSIIGLFSLVYGTIQAGENGWLQPNVLIAFAVGVVFLAAFLWWENHSSNPMLPLHFFKNMAFTGANAALTFSAFAMMGSMYFFSQYLQTILGYPPLLAALGMLPMTPAVLISTLSSVRLDRKLGTKFTIALGLVLSGAGLFMFSAFAGLATPYWQVLLVLLVLGIGIGFIMSPATNSVMSSLPPNRAGIGSAMNDTTRQLGGALGVAILGALMNGIYRSHVAALAKVNGISPANFSEILSSVQNAHMAATKLAGDASALVIQTSSLAFVAGMDRAFFIGSVAMILGAVAAWMILPNKPKPVLAESQVSELTEKE